MYKVTKKLGRLGIEKVGAHAGEVSGSRDREHGWPGPAPLGEALQTTGTKVHQPLADTIWYIYDMDNQGCQIPGITTWQITRT